MKQLLVTFVVLTLAHPAFGLSCMPHDLARVYAEAAQSEDRYIVVHGILHFDERKLPKVDWDHQHETPPDTLIPAELTGKSLSLEGFEREFDEKIILNAQCFGPWCAGAVSDKPYLAFLRRAGDDYVLAITPCGGFGFAEPSQQTLDKTLQCFRGATCEPEPFE